MSMYAILEGLFIGGFSYMIENYYLGGTEGVVLQALVGTWRYSSQCWLYTNLV